METILFDPSGIASARQEFDVTPFIRESGPDWGDAAIAAVKAQMLRGELPVGHRVPNRLVQLPFQALERGPLTFEDVRRQVQAKVGLFQEEGGWISRETVEGVVYADVVDATLKMGGSTQQALGFVDADIVVTLECLPEWYGDEIQLAQHSELAAAELIWTEVGIRGDYPGRVRVSVDELDGDAQLAMLVAFRARHYSAASTAALAYEAEALTPLDVAALATLSGASGGASNNVVAHTNLGTQWTPVLSTNLLAGGAFLTHTGTYRVYARLRSPDGSSVKARFVYDVGDLALPRENDAWTFPAQDNLYTADLGEIRLDRVPIGTHRWAGQIQAKGAAGGEDIQVDKLWFVPLDDGAIRLRSPAPAVDGLTTRIGRDGMNQTAGALNGKTADVGGTWATSTVGAGADFQVETAGKTAQRTAASDGGNLYHGRSAVLGSSIVGAVLAQVDFKWSLVSQSSLRSGVLLRWTDSNNNLAAYIQYQNGQHVLVIREVVAGVTTEFFSPAFGPITADAWYTLRAVADADGRVFAWIFPQNGSPGDPKIATRLTSAATGGTLANGKAGFVDWTNAAGPGTRSYDNFLSYVPTLDAVLFPNQSAEIRTDGCFREDSAGNAFGPISERVGDLPRIPVAGLEGRTVQCFIKASRGDLNQLPDSGIDDIRAVIAYRPCWLQTPEAA